MPNSPNRPYADTRATKFVAKRIDELSSRRRPKSQREIAFEAGFKMANILSMIKSGDSKVPLDRVPSLAKALEVDERILFRLTVEQHFRGSDLHRLVDKMGAATLTDNEVLWLELMRELTDNTDPAPTEPMKNAMREALASWFAPAPA